ncbi:maleylpyruvate isomerase family mycothiol-dependent enzyme [Actinocrispum wychmicini]|uniref:Uncharacterized protein (TIGR03083 family) n=1 Tax=Actinocrispum wychmicini TaxID=1213861 RepID=A0A4R2J784_9PSEU|nr:maleylpyruvate isomerase family mycothiol-dependent enzyme [Actinocrispum wychmicini]TCO54943.1 uncharacterized protein (TIGR03083 family) [Actinocrispum wychmicini]
MNLGDHLIEQTDAFADLVKDANPDARVPTCPDWSLRVLVAHMGQAPRWAAGIVRTRAAAAIPDPTEADPGPQREWPEWLHAGATDLVKSVADDPDVEVWTVVGPRPASFWLRRILCDLVVHRADAAFTAGKPYDVAPELAAEAISEGLRLFEETHAQPGTGETLLVRPNDAAPWRITLTPDGMTAERGGDAADVVVSGPARDLLLAFTRRIPPAAVTVSGDHALLERWLANIGL